MLLRSGFKHLLLAVVYGSLGLVLGGVVIFSLHMRDRPDLSPWHEAELDEEFTVASASRVTDLAAYRQHEDALFDQLREQVLDRVRSLPSGQQRLNRYAAGSWVDPLGFDHNWNRTFELQVDDPRAGFLMLHGLSDSPYSMRALGESLHARGAWVVGLRLPGHGTAPAGLARVDWRDFIAAVRLAARDMAAQLGPGRPLYIAGYSNGAALAVEYTLAALEDKALPMPAGLLLLSPALAVSPTAALAQWNLRLAKLPGMKKLAWLSIQPEYDPYKYNSFAVNAGEQIYRLTRTIAERFARLDNGRGVANFPPVLAFQSVVDATIPAEAVVQQLFARLAPNGHELVLFDINREAETNALFAKDPRAGINALFETRQPFNLTLITNRDAGSLELLALHQAEGATEITRQETGLVWPDGIFSLSHLALPFPPDDPLYGIAKHESEAGLPALGSVDLRGETGVLQVPLSQLMRLRYNPFFDYLEGRVTDQYLPLTRASINDAKK
jgi:alpha-beta hydrolase superfamily lysophospholipase